MLLVIIVRVLTGSNKIPTLAKCKNGGRMNPNAFLRFYKRLGFQVTGKRLPIHNSPIQEVFLEWNVVQDTQEYQLEGDKQAGLFESRGTHMLLHPSIGEDSSQLVVDLCILPVVISRHEDLVERLQELADKLFELTLQLASMLIA